MKKLLFLTLLLVSVFAYSAEYGKIKTNASISNKQLSVAPSIPSSGYQDLYFKDDGNFYSLDSAGLEKAITSSNQVYISTVADFPTPTDTSDGNGVAIHLANGVTYTLTQDVSSSYTIVAPANYGFGLLTSLGPQTYTYTGSGIAFTASNKKLGSFGVQDVFVSAPSGTLFDFESDDPSVGSYFYMNIIYAFDINRIGYARANVSLDLFFTGFIDCGDGLTLDSTDSVYIGGASWWTGWKNQVGSVKITVIGACDNLVMDGWVFENQSNETAFDIQVGSTMGGANVSSGVVKGAGTVFKAGSKTQTDPSWSFSGVSGTPDSQTVGSLYMERNSTVTTITATGTNAVITAFEDATGGKTRVLTGTTPTDGTIVWIINDSYSGKYTTSNTVLNTSFEIVKAFSGTDTGTWENNWVKVAGTTLPMQNERASMTGNNQLTFSNLEEQQVHVNVSTNPKNSGVAAAKDWEFAVMKNNIRLKGSLKFRQMTDKAGEGVILCTTTAVSGDIFEVYVRNILDTTDMIMVNMSVVISK